MRRSGRPERAAETPSSSPPGAASAAGDQCGAPRVEVGLAREPRRRALEPPGGLQQQQRCLAARGGGPVDLGAELLDPGPLEVVDRVGLGLGQRAAARRRTRPRAGARARPPERGPRVDPAPRSARPPAPGTPRLPASPARASARSAARSSSAPPSSSGSGRGGRQVPDPPVRIGLGHRSPPPAPGAPRAGPRAEPAAYAADAHQRVPEPHAGADLEQLLSLAPARPRHRPRPSSLRRPPQQRRVPGRRRPPPSAAAAGSAPAAPAPAPGSGPPAGPWTVPRAGRAKPPAELRIGHPADQLEQRQRVASRVSATSRSRTRSSSWPGVAAVSSARASSGARPSTRQLRQAGEQPAPAPVSRTARTSRTDSADQPPGDHAEHLAGRLVQPLRVVDQHDQRLLGCHVREHARAQPGRRRSGPAADRRRGRGPPAGPASWCAGTALHLAEQWSAELVERRERQLQLRLDTRRAGRRGSRWPGARRTAGARSCRCLPRPRRTSTALSPPRTRRARRSSASRSPERPRRSGAGAAMAPQ